MLLLLKTQGMKNPWWNDFLSLFFPLLCLLCRQNQRSTNQPLCLACQAKLSPTNLHLYQDNEFTDRFIGRVQLETAAALYYFSKTSKVQILLHLLKYGDRPMVGVQLGRFYGQLLKEQALFSTIDLIIPVPLHPKRERQRGYNQSTQFAIGLSEVLNVPYSEDVLERRIYTPTQTGKNRVDRLENVLTAFQLKQKDLIADKHILLVDDVLTTGATLEACALQLQKASNVKISMAAIAIAMH